MKTLEIKGGGVAMVFQVQAEDAMLELVPKLGGGLELLSAGRCSEVGQSWQIALCLVLIAGISR